MRCLNQICLNHDYLMMSRLATFKNLIYITLTFIQFTFFYLYIHSPLIFEIREPLQTDLLERQGNPGQNSTFSRTAALCSTG